MLLKMSCHTWHRARYVSQTFQGTFHALTIRMYSHVCLSFEDMILPLYSTFASTSSATNLAAWYILSEQFNPTQESFGFLTRLHLPILHSDRSKRERILFFFLSKYPTRNFHPNFFLVLIYFLFLFHRLSWRHRTMTP